MTLINLPAAYVILFHRQTKFMKGKILFFLLVLAGQSALAQSMSKETRQELEKKEDTLKDFARKMVFSENAAERFRSDSNFVRTFVRALQTPQSFYYSFDSVNISKLYSPDSSFRIFTWELKKDEYVILQKGAIQMRTADGSLKLFRLQDISMFTRRPQDSARTNLNWIGAIYYKMIMKEWQGKKYYTLFGFDDFSINSNKKWVEVLSFNNNGEPVFGGPFFSYKNDTGSEKKPVQARIALEYKKEARAFANFDPELDLIIIDHLISETDEPEKKFTYVPDGDYEAFRWENGQWVHINKLFNQALKDGDFPKEALIYDDNGKPDDKILEDASRKNLDKKPSPAPVKKTTPPAPVKKKGDN